MESTAVTGLLGFTGEAEGAGIAITDGSGSVVSLGQPTAGQTLVGENNTLVFSAYLQGSTASDAIKPESLQRCRLHAGLSISTPFFNWTCGFLRMSSPLERDMCWMS